MNNIIFRGKTICLDCRDLFEKMLRSHDLNEIENINSKLLSLNSKGQDVESFITEHLNNHLKEVKIERQKFEEEQEKKRKLYEEEQERQRKLYEEEQEKKQKEQEDRDAFLKENGHEGYYEYKILNIVDDRTGCVNINEISNQLNTLGRQGWHLRCAYTNELGKNASSLGVGGVSLGTNSTVDQSILILERFIKFK